MDDLSGSNHQIKLTIREGRNFENVPYPTIIVASLNNHSLETDLIQQDNNPQYLTDLIWEVQKKQLRTMRSAHTPLKIECFASNEKGTKDKLGYILLSIRTAQIIHKHEEVEIRFNWHSLSGLKGDLKSSKPELLISLVIHEFASNEEMKKMNQKSLSYQSITPVLLEHEHLIQLGPVDSCHDLFLITIMAGIVNNLDILIKESILNEQMEEVAIWSHILDNDIKLKPFKRSSERQWILNEKIVIRMRSSLAVLKNYFQTRPYLLIFLKLKDHLVAESKLDVRPLLFTDCLDEFVRKTQNASTSLEQQCTLLKEGETFNASHEPKASISIKFKIQYVDKKFEQSHFPKIPPYTVPQKSQSAENHQRIKDSQPIRMNNFESHKHSAGDYRSNVLRNDVELDNILYNNQFASLQNVIRDNEELHFANDHTKNIESFHCYCLNVYLTGITLFPNCPMIRNFEFRFHHPKAEIMSALHPSVPVMSGGRLVLQNIGCKLHFISSAEEIKNLLTSFPPRISVCDDNANAKICIAQTSLDVQRLFNQHKTECQYEALLVDADGNQIGILEILMNLEDHGPYYNDKTRNTSDNLGPPILDDSLVYKIVDELESWKEKQKQLFKIELQNKEEHYLNLLGEEWRKKKEALEAKLANNTEQCKMLANCLNNATEDLRIRRLKSHEKETRLMKANEEIRSQYEMKLQQLRSAAEKMQDEFATKLTLFEECKASYESQLDNLKRENEALRHNLKFHEERLMEYEKLLTPEQVTTLLKDVKTLEENLAKAEESKNYYKEQWAIVQEDMQEMKTKYRQLMELQIKNSKDDKIINYEDILSANSEALLNDQIFLDQMQKKLDIIGPTKSSRLIMNAETSYPPLNSLLSKPSQSLQSAEFSALNSEREAKINMINQEKMDLLKTGTVPIDDPLIIKMDNQIKLLSAMI